MQKSALRRRGGQVRPRGDTNGSGSSKKQRVSRWTRIAACGCRYKGGAKMPISEKAWPLEHEFMRPYHVPSRDPRNHFVNITLTFIITIALTPNATQAYNLS